MNIIKREIKANLKSLMLWVLFVALIIAMASTEYEAFKDIANVNEMMEAFPPELMKAFSIDLVRFDEVQGFFSYIGQYFMMMGAIFAVLLGTKILSKEVSRKTAETTFTLPVTRKYMILMKLTAAVISCLLFAIGVFAVSYLAFMRFDIEPNFVQKLFVFCAYMLLIEVLFVLAGLFASVMTKNHKRIGTIMASMTVGIYMMSFIANISEKYAFLNWFVPFDYFNAIDVMHGNELSILGFIVVPVLIIGFTALSFGLVEKKDVL